MSTTNAELGNEDLVTEAKNLFEYLARAQSLRERSIYRVSEYDEVLWLGNFPDHSAVSSAHRSADPQQEDALFSLSRVVRRDPPDVPDDLVPWIEGKVHDPNVELSIADAIPAEKAPQCTPRSNEDGISEVILLEDESEILLSADEYIDQWRKWAEQERLDAPVRKLYDQLFQVMNQVASHGETFELVLGVGALAWQPLGHQAALRHVLTFAVQIEFDDESGLLIGRRSDEGSPVKVELDMLDPSLITAHVNNLRSEAKNYDGHPLHQDNLYYELARFANGLDAHGSYSDAEFAPEITNDPRIAFAPALIVRKRSQRGLIDMFEKIQQQIELADEVPAGLLPMIDPNYEVVAKEDNSSGGMIQIGADSEELFLPMPVNERQLKVIQQVNSKAQVVVQGPPGTGKTHTAAALLSHLLAQGKRVLVTAQTDRALHEVRGKLPDSIRPLSVAVVGNSQAEMSDLRVAVETINNHADEYDASRSARDIAEHSTSIDRLRRERAETFTKLRQSRESETTHHVVGSYSGTLATIVRKLQNEEADYGWIESLATVGAGSTPPLNTSEALRWLDLLNDWELNSDGEESLSRYPAVNALSSPAEISAMIDGEAHARSVAQGHEAIRQHEIYVDIQALELTTRNALHERTSNLVKRMNDLESRTDGWVSDALSDIRAGRGGKWLARYEQVSELTIAAAPFVDALGLATTVEFDSAQLPLLQDLANAIKGYMEQGGDIKKNLDGTPKIGMFTNKVVRQSQIFFDQVRVDGRSATELGSVDKFLSYARGTNLLDAAERLWPDNIQIPNDDTLNERLQWHRDELGQLAKVLELGEALAEAERWVSSHGVRVPNWADIANVQSYSELVDAAMSADALESQRSPLEQLSEVLGEQQRWENSSPVVSSLMQAVNDRDRNAYEIAYLRVVHLHKVKERNIERRHLDEKLTDRTKSLVEAVRADPTAPSWVTRLGSLSAAWDWASTRSWIRSVESADVNRLQNRLNSLEDLLRREIEGLAATRAWSHAVNDKRMSGAARAHLQQYAQLVRRLGKGTGKYAVKQREEIRKALDHCRPSVPVWIMPLYRIADQFQVEPNMFDVVLVDEASQAGLEASFLQYLAPKIVVIGDDRQVSPSAVGIDQQQLRDLANQYLPNNPFKSSWQDPKRSYFDEATMRFGGKITLIEHRRCVPEIIGFSNKIAYEPDGIRLLPVRQRTAGSLPPVKAVHVRDGYETGKTNRPEAIAIVEQIVACIKDPAYDGKSMGVISLIGKEQAKLTTGLIMERLAPEEWQERDLRCGDAADFQGSERDVIFLSMVKTADGERRVGSLTADTYIQRYNVAASRARDQMWLFHSLLLSDLGNPQDMRHALLDYVTSVERRQDQTDERVLTEQVSENDRVVPFDSLFEQRVFNRIYSRGYSVIPQYPSEGYKIDLVVIGANGNLAIECDGDAWHGPEQYYADMARQRDLERCGWSFYRIRESVFYMDKEAALAELWPLLEELNKVQEPAPTNPVDAQLDDSEIAGADLPSSEESSMIALREELTPVHAERNSVEAVATMTQDEFGLERVSRGRHAVMPEPAGSELADMQEDVHPDSIAVDAEVDDGLFDSADFGNGANEGLSFGAKTGYIFGDVHNDPIHEEPDSAETTTGIGNKAGYIFGEIDDERASVESESSETATARFVKADNSEITTYEHFRGEMLPALEATRQQIIDSLVEILFVEGPVVGGRLETVYSKSSGQKLGRHIVGAIENALRKAVRDGVIIEDKPLNEKFIKSRTYRLPEQSMFRKRTAGERDIDEVPVIELAALLRAQMVDHDVEVPGQDVYRAVLADLGFRRLTSNAEKRLDAAYRFLDIG